MKDNLDSLDHQMKKMQDLNTDLERRNESLKREIDILTQDKGFLSRENANMEDRVKRLEDKLDRTEQEMIDAKKQAHTYMERVLNTNDDVKNRFEDKYGKEVTDLKERHAKELDLAKRNLQEIYEKRIEYLKESKEESDRRLQRLE